MFRHPLVLAALSLSLTFACSSSQEPQAEAEEAAEAMEEELPSEPPPPTPAPLDFIAKVEATEEQPGREQQLSADAAEQIVETAASFAIRSEHALPKLRVRLLDAAGRVVPSRDEASIGQGSVYSLRPVEELVPGSLYRLIADSQEGSRLQDVEGTEYLPLSLTFRTAGEKPDPSKKKRGRR